MSAPFYVQGQAAADRAVDQIQKIEAAVKQMKEEAVAAEELSAVQNRLIDEFNRELSSTYGLCNLMLDAELYRLGSNYTALYTSRIWRCDEEAIQQAVNDWIFPGGEILVLRGPMKSLKTSLTPLGSFQKLPQ